MKWNHSRNTIHHCYQPKLNQQIWTEAVQEVEIVSNKGKRIKKEQTALSVKSCGIFCKNARSKVAKQSDVCLPFVKCGIPTAF